MITIAIWNICSHTPHLWTYHQVIVVTCFLEKGHTLMHLVLSIQLLFNLHSITCHQNTNSIYFNWLPHIFLNFVSLVMFGLQTIEELAVKRHQQSLVMLMPMGVWLKKTKNQKWLYWICTLAVVPCQLACAWVQTCLVWILWL